MRQVFSGTIWALALGTGLGAGLGLGAAKASTVNLLNGGTTGVVFAGSNLTGSVGDTVTSNVRVGAFTMQEMESSSSSSVLSSFIAWCIDLSNTLKRGDFQSSPEFPTASVTPGWLDNAATRASALFNSVYSESIAGNATKAAGFQLALWNVIYDDDLTLDAGQFRVTAGTKADRQAAIAAGNGFLQAFDSDKAGGGPWTLTFWEPTRPTANQRLVSAAIPLPAAGWLLLGGLGGLALTAARRRGRAAV